MSFETNGFFRRITRDLDSGLNLYPSDLQARLSTSAVSVCYKEAGTSVTGVTRERDAFRNWRTKNAEICIGQG